MRIAPMALLFSCSKLKVSNYKQFIKDEIRLIHPKEVLQEAGFLWVEMLTKLIKRDNN